MLDQETARQLIEAEECSAEDSLQRHYALQFEYFQNLIAAIRVTLEQHRSQMPTDSPGKLLPPFLFCKLLRTARAVRRLCKAGYGVEAMLLVRSALETLINLLFLTDRDSEQRAEVYIRHDWVITKKQFDRVWQWPEIHNNPLYVERRNRAEADYHRFKQDYPRKDFWAGKFLSADRRSLRGMATEINLEWYFDFVYPFGSNHMHSNAKSANEYVEVTEDRSVIYKFGPSERYSEVPLNLISDFLIRGFERLLAFYRLDAHDTLASVKNAHDSVFEKVRSHAPGEPDSTEVPR